MEELLIFVAQVLVEALIYFPWDVLLYAEEGSKRGSPNTFIWSTVSLGIGGLFGGITLLLVPNALLQWAPLRMLGLFLSPILAGVIATRIATRRVTHKDTVQVRTHFWGAFMCTAGVVIVRFAFSHR